MSNCGILHTDKTLGDTNGCLKPEAHNDSHIFKSKYGKYIEWEDDPCPNCNCEYDYCTVYSKVDKPKFL